MTISKISKHTSAKIAIQPNCNINFANTFTKTKLTQILFKILKNCQHRQE